MSLENATAGLAALWLILLSQLVTAHTGWQKIWAGTVPVILGVTLEYFVLARIFGWPV